MPYVTAINIQLRHNMDHAIIELDMIQHEYQGAVKAKIQGTRDAMIRAGLMIRLVEKLINDDLGVDSFLDEIGGIK